MAKREKNKNEYTKWLQQQRIVCIGNRATEWNEQK